jgi:glutamine amidotransferase
MMVDRVGIIDYGSMGNIESMRQALEAAGAEDIAVLRTKSDFEGIDKYVLPGVGAFREAIAEIQSRDLFDSIQKAARAKPILGVCLGMQLLATVGYEYGETRGLNLIPGEVRLMLCNAAVPNMGFRPIKLVNESLLFRGVSEGAEFYFMHSYEFVNYTDICALSDNGGHNFVASISRGNIHGVQFHPEKSREQGIVILENFINL